jgi:hypothetical protein
MRATAPEPRRRRRPPLAAAASLLAAAVLVACGSAPSPAAVTFVRERRDAAARAQHAIALAEQRLAALGAAPTSAQLASLGEAAQAARTQIDAARSGLPTYQTAEEEVPIAESEAGVGGNELGEAMAYLEEYSTSPSPQALANYRGLLKRGSAQWNEAVRELWRLARTSNPPTV